MEDSKKTVYTEQIMASFKEKSTEELERIWKENDRDQWSDEAFGVVRSLLLERTGSLPTQNRAVVEEDDEDRNYDAVVRISLLANVVSYVIAAIALALTGLTTYSVVLSGSFMNWQSILNALINILLPLTVGAFLFVFAQALGRGLLLLADIQENTRGANARDND